jgi:peroxiredoxin (alkyl hydroperoxide reductase subunit C)
MSEATPPLRVGDSVPDFKITTFEATKKGFGEFDFAAAKKAGSWTVLFFYPADFTFV